MVAATKSHFACHGIPERLITDNGPQFISQVFKSFCEDYTICHVTSSPYWPRGNGKAESAVKVVKMLLKKSKDFQLALLFYRNTPQQGHDFSPAQRSMGRRTRTTIPTPRALLVTPSSSTVQQQIFNKRSLAKKYYDKSASFQDKIIMPGDFVYAKPAPRDKGAPWKYGKVKNNCGFRSLVVETSSGPCRHNQAQLRLASAPPVLLPNSEVASSTTPFDNIYTSVSQGGANTLGQPEACSAQALVQGLPASPVQCPNVPVRTGMSGVNESATSTSQNVQLPTSPNVQLPSHPGVPRDGYKTRSGRPVRARQIFDPSA